MNILKKNKALKIIIQQRIKEQTDAPFEEDEVGWEVIPDGIFLRGCDVLKIDVEKTNHKAFAILELWWLNSNRNKQELGVPFFKVFHSWGKLFQLISLCVLSSALVERYFSLLEFYKSDSKEKMIHDELEASLLMRFNDTSV